MEGFSPWTILVALAGYALALISFLLVLVAAGFLLARRCRLALTIFASAVFAISVSAAFFIPTTTPSSSPLWLFSCGAAAGLFLAGIGQLLTERRHPKNYPASLGCFIISMTFVAGPMSILGI